MPKKPEKALANKTIKQVPRPLWERIIEIARENNLYQNELLLGILEWAVNQYDKDKLKEKLKRKRKEKNAI